MKLKKSYFLHLIVFIILVFIDQLTKHFVRIGFEDGSTMEIIPDVLVFCFHKNTGAAWSIMSDKTVFLIVITIVLILGLLYAYFKAPFKPRLTTFKLLVVFILAGAVGNLIDRIFFQYVTDFIYFKIIDFPIFNIADCYITVTAIVFLVMMFFYFKEDDFNFIPFLMEKKKDKDAANG